MTKKKQKRKRGKKKRKLGYSTMSFAYFMSRFERCSILRVRGRKFFANSR